MKQKHLLYGIAGGLAVLLYFKFGTKKIIDLAPNKALAQVDPKIVTGGHKLPPIKFGDPRDQDDYKSPPFRPVLIGEIGVHGYPVATAIEPQYNMK